TVSTVGPGQLFGWSALFPGRRKQASARALEPTWAIALDAARLHEAFRLDPKLEVALIHRVTEVIANRLASTRRQLTQTK
ncbi:MAG: cyclic nucleotide-binding domain-containing protein, partial [Anaerolineae bacterium]